MASVGISTGIFGARFEPAKHLPMVAQAGFTAIELNLYSGNRFHWQDPAAVGDLRRRGADLGIAVWSVHSPGDHSLGERDDHQRQQHIGALRGMLDLADELGASRVVSHGMLYGEFANDREGTVQRMVESVGQLLPRVCQGRASLAFENSSFGPDQPWLGCDVLKLVQSLNEPKQIGFVLDVGHAHIAGELLSLCGALGPELISLHLHDNDGHDDNHRVPTEGTLDWLVVRAMLDRVGYDGCMMYEISDYGGLRPPVDLLAATMSHHRRWYPPRA